MKQKKEELSVQNVKVRVQKKISILKRLIPFRSGTDSTLTNRKWFRDEICQLAFIIYIILTFFILTRMLFHVKTIVNWEILINFIDIA